MNENRVSLDSSKSLKAVDELIELTKGLSADFGEIETTLNTAYANDNLMFYSKMSKQACNYKEALKSVADSFTKVSDDLVDHSNRMNKHSEEY